MKLPVSYTGPSDVSMLMMRLIINLYTGLYCVSEEYNTRYYNLCSVLFGCATLSVTLKEDLGESHKIGVLRRLYCPVG